MTWKNHVEDPSFRVSAETNSGNPASTAFKRPPREEEKIGDKRRANPSYLLQRTMAAASATIYRSLNINPAAKLPKIVGVVISAGLMHKTVKVRMGERVWDKHIKKVRDAPLPLPLPLPLPHSASCLPPPHLSPGG